MWCLCGMAELTATSKAELQKMGVLPGHANLLLQRARKPFDVQPAPKQPKASRIFGTLEGPKWLKMGSFHLIVHPK